MAVMRSPDSDETGEVSGGGESLAEGFGTFLDGDEGADDETSFGEGDTQGASDTSALEGLEATDGTSNAYGVEPDEVPSEEDYDYTGDGHVDGQDFHEAITSLFDFGVEEEHADAHHDTHDAPDAHHVDDGGAAHHDDGAFDLF
jgi:hypothetical protein